MKLLFDQGTPAPLRKYLPLRAVETAYEKGWQNIGNGELLSQAEAAGFDALITTDQNLRYQQNPTGRKISIVALMTTSWPRIHHHLTAVVSVIDHLQSGSYIEISIPCGWLYATSRKQFAYPSILNAAFSSEIASEKIALISSAQRRLLVRARDARAHLCPTDLARRHAREVCPDD